MARGRRTGWVEDSPIKNGQQPEGSNKKNRFETKVGFFSVAIGTITHVTSKPAKYSMVTVENHIRTATRIAILIALAFAAFAVAPESAAQYNTLAVGAEIGSPTAVTVLVPTEKRYAFEFLGAWDLDDFLFLNAHALVTRATDDYPELHAIWGIGAFVGIRDNASSSATLGISGKFGAGYDIEPFEVYVHLTPRFELMPETDFHLGGGLGLRFFTGK
ncbi:MAG: hypothetical protein HKN43_11440 [Rhodothermales bacterium]|nr:hypothetical protein [Rhodothermales bacterium]